MSSHVEITQPQQMRALAHPLRLRILKVLGEIEPATATQIAGRVGESVANCSFHLRTLAKYGFVEDAGGGQGRNRPWRHVPFSYAIDSRTASPGMLQAAEAFGKAQEAIGDTPLRRIEHWKDDDAKRPASWQEASFGLGRGLRVTPEELTQIRRQIEQVLDRFDDRDDPPAGAARAEFWAWGFPNESPEELHRKEASRAAGSTPATDPPADR